MDTQKNIKELVLNPDNPRTMSEFMEGKLIESLLVFPKMLEARPIIINKDNIILGGNQRTTALLKILEMDDADIDDYLFNQKKFRDAPAGWQNEITKYWADWQKNPVVPVRVVEDFTKEEETELLVKDNLHYGEDDIDIMKQNFDREYISDFFGSVAWNMYDYTDRINDEGLDLSKSYPEKFKCGYVECSLTNEEYVDLCHELENFIAAHEGVSDGFLTHLLQLA